MSVTIKQNKSPFQELSLGPPHSSQAFYHPKASFHIFPKTVLFQASSFLSPYCDKYHDQNNKKQQNKPTRETNGLSHLTTLMSSQGKPEQEIVARTKRQDWLNLQDLLILVSYTVQDHLPRRDPVPSMLGPRNKH